MVAVRVTLYPSVVTPIWGIRRFNAVVVHHANPCFHSFSRFILLGLVYVTIWRSLTLDYFTVWRTLAWRRLGLGYVTVWRILSLRCAVVAEFRFLDLYFCWCRRGAS